MLSPPRRSPRERTPPTIPPRATEHALPCSPSPRSLASCGHGSSQPAAASRRCSCASSFSACWRRRAERPQATGPPRVCCVVTAQMAPSGGASTRSPGELRRRRWADAKKKSKLLAAELGCEFESVDAASPNFLPAKLEAAVESCDCVWVTGGNTFYLWHHMRASGLDQMVKHRLTQPGAFYFGQSAGSIVAGRSVSTAFLEGLGRSLGGARYGLGRPGEPRGDGARRPLLLPSLRSAVGRPRRAPKRGARPPGGRS